MEKTDKNEKQQRIDYLKKKIMILEWDKEKNQLNPGKATYLKKIKEELIELHNQNEVKNDNKEKKESEKNE
jgi:hypothetical protein